MKPKTPQPIKNGHENLSSELKNIIDLKGNIAQPAQILYEVMSDHFEKEEKYALPPLSFLLALSKGNWEINSNEAIKMADKLQSKLAELTQDHENILKSLEDLEVMAEAENNVPAKQFVKNLRIHAEVEDQVLYPTTILIGNYLKNIKLHQEI